jgi:hypothetical protein
MEATLQKQAYKLENLRNKIRCVEQLDDSPQTTKTTKIVTTVKQLQADLAALLAKVEDKSQQQTPVNTEPNVIDLTNVEKVSALPSSSTEVQDNAIVKTVTITVEPEIEELRIETSDDILARQVQIENARAA